MNKAIVVTGLSKIYRLGEIGTGTISHDLHRWISKMRGKGDPFLKIGEANDRTRKGGSDIVYSLQDLNFDIQQGDAVGIIGRNGAGKSTLLKILSRVTSPTTGKIHIRGRVASLLEVGTGFHPELTGRENIYLNGAILGMRKKEITRKLEQIIDFSGVERYIDTPVKRYSSGMYVRLAFAVAAHLESEILIVDEVLAVGDAEFQQKCLGKMGEVSKGEGRTILFVSHNMGAISALCSNGLLIEKGGIRCKGEIASVIRTYHADTEMRAKEELKNRTDRIGNKTLLFNAVWIENEHGEMVDTLVSGANYYIVTEMKKQNAEKLFGNLTIAFAIYDSFGYQITDLSNLSSSNSTFFQDIPDTLIVKCCIQQLPLNEGSYRYNVYCRLNNDVVDSVEYAAFFNVNSGDFFGTGKLPSANQGKVLFKQNWLIQ